MTKTQKLNICFILFLIIFLIALAGIISNIFADETIINVNTATHSELVELKGIGKVKANRIIALRPFVHIDSLITVKGIGLKTMVWIYPFVTVQDSGGTHIHQEGE